jgi:hypothetical protein
MIPTPTANWTCLKHLSSSRPSAVSYLLISCLVLRVTDFMCNHILAFLFEHILRLHAPVGKRVSFGARQNHVHIRSIGVHDGDVAGVLSERSAVEEDFFPSGENAGLPAFN